MMKKEKKTETEKQTEKVSDRISITDSDYIEVAAGFVRLPSDFSAIKVKRVPGGARVNNFLITDEDAQFVARRRAERALKSQKYET